MLQVIATAYYFIQKLLLNAMTEKIIVRPAGIATLISLIFRERFPKTMLSVRKSAFDAQIRKFYLFIKW